MGKGVNYFFPLTQLEGDPLFRDNFSSYERAKRDEIKLQLSALFKGIKRLVLVSAVKDYLCTYFEILHCFESQTEQAGLAQSVERMTAEREVAGSIPVAGPLLRVF